jgi:dTDP-4-dehydrorhamnose reductase
MNKTILVTGANGQLGMELQHIAQEYTGFHFVFTTRHEMPLDDMAAIEKVINEHKPAYVVNCAAYTAVDKAETEKELAYQINAEAAGVIASTCKKNNAQLIHISTDYVFKGDGNRPYSEDDPTDAVNLYGDSKLQGEKKVLKEDPSSIIIRTAWVYSAFGKNFVKTMLRLMSEKERINVVSDQYGTPTYAADLAEAIMKIITVLDDANKQAATNDYGGIYHFSNDGNISWYDFAVAIRDLSASTCVVNPIPTAQYPTPASRPAYSVLDKSKIRGTFGVIIKDWKGSLANCLKQLQKA